MKLHFSKYQGTGNDFIVIDNRNGIFDSFNSALVSTLCNRRFGIGADGLMLLENCPESDFKMIYFNADGKEGSMCGNGGRCITAFAKSLGIIGNKSTFMAVDGLHESIIRESGEVELKMGEISQLYLSDAFCFLNTGSPHYIKFVDDLSDIHVEEQGKKIRYSETYKKEGVNVNFVEEIGRNQLKVYNYERGVEAETLSCGTGVTAASITYFLKEKQKIDGKQVVKIQVKGGKLEVKFDYFNHIISDIWLCGPAEKVFEGIIIT
jgi:diaminopimelate epimerase